jgi:hypothetical protein
MLIERLREIRTLLLLEEDPAKRHHLFEQMLMIEARSRARKGDREPEAPTPPGASSVVPSLSDETEPHE